MYTNLEEEYHILLQSLFAHHAPMKRKTFLALMKWKHENPGKDETGNATLYDTVTLTPHAIELPSQPNAPSLSSLCICNWSKIWDFYCKKGTHVTVCLERKMPPVFWTNIPFHLIYCTLVALQCRNLTLLKWKIIDTISIHLYTFEIWIYTYT